MRRLALICGCALALWGCKESEPEVPASVRADGHYLAGTTAYLKGDFAEAHAQFEKVRALAPSDPRLAAAEGEVWLSEGKLTEATAAFETAVKSDPKRSTNHSRLGYLYATKGEGEKARASLEKALALNPKDFNAHEALAGVELQAGHLDEAVAQWVLASDSAPGEGRAELVLKASAALMKAGRTADAVVALEAAVKKGFATSALHTELGDALVELSRFDEGIAAYTEAAKADPTDPTLWELVGELNARMDRLGPAREAFANSLKVKDRGVVHVALARLCRKQKDDACTKAELDKALTTSTGEEQRETLELAGLLEELGRPGDAVELLKMVDAEPDEEKNLELHLRTARVAKVAGQKAVVDEACGRALKVAPPGQRCP